MDETGYAAVADHRHQGRDQPGGMIDGHVPQSSRPLLKNAHFCRHTKRERERKKERKKDKCARKVAIIHDKEKNMSPNKAKQRKKKQDKKEPKPKKKTDKKLLAWETDAWDVGLGWQ